MTFAPGISSAFPNTYTPIQYRSILYRANIQTPSSPNFIQNCQCKTTETDKNEIYTVALAVGTGLFILDNDVKNIVQRQTLHNDISSKIFQRIEPFGRKGIYYASVPLFITQGLVFKNKKSLMVGAELFVGFQVANGFTYLVKSGFGRKRPFESDSPYDFFKGGSAFYSGHTVNIFTFATILSKNYPKQDLNLIGIDKELPVVPILSYSIAGLVGLQRLYDNSHWASDVYFGALAGYVFGSLIVHFGNKFLPRYL